VHGCCADFAFSSALSLSRNASQVTTVDAYEQRVAEWFVVTRSPVTIILRHPLTTTVGTTAIALDVPTIGGRYDHRITLIQLKLFCDATPMSLPTFFEMYVYGPDFFPRRALARALEKKSITVVDSLYSTRSFLKVDVSTNWL